MFNKKKLMIMTKLAMYEKLESEHLARATKYFRGDYIGWNIIKTICAITIVYFLCAGMWFLYNSEMLLQNITSLNYIAIIRYAIILYVTLLVAYFVIAYMVYSVKYHKATKALKKYEKGLKQLAKIYVEEASEDGSETPEDADIEVED
ncbi:MAG: hypothetical protein IJW18_06180 [Lachnospiraceae bacterium]|nr:hypothetical protein [Lachnospiraceae bacterium]